MSSVVQRDAVRADGWFARRVSRVCWNGVRPACCCSFLSPPAFCILTTSVIHPTFTGVCPFYVQRDTTTTRLENVKYQWWVRGGVARRAAACDTRRNGTKSCVFRHFYRGDAPPIGIPPLLSEIYFQPFRLVKYRKGPCARAAGWLQPWLRLAGLPASALLTTHIHPPKWPLTNGHCTQCCAAHARPQRRARVSPLCSANTFRHPGRNAECRMATD